MRQLRFNDLPMVVRLTSALSMILAWITFEEIVIDRDHLDRFLPYYRVGQFCSYDAAALFLVVMFWIAAHRRKDDPSTPR